MKFENRRVVITGMGTLNPLGNNVASTWENAAAGNSGTGRITHFDASEYKTQIAAEVKDFDATALFGRKEARRMDRVTQFALAAATDALTDSNLVVTDKNSSRIGVIVGSGMGLMKPTIDSVNTFNERGPYRVSPFFVPMMLADTPAAMISITHNLRGPNLAVYTACATGNNALGEAAVAIKRGTADVMLAGGAEACILPLTLAGFGVMGAISTRNEEPERASRPFDKTRDGFVIGEGAAILVLEELEHACARKAYIYGELTGYGASSDAFHISMPAENGEGAGLSMQMALADAGLEAAAIDAINAHGTSTPLNDKTETKAIKKAFGDHAYSIPISSTKSMHGHLLGATGALEAILCLKIIDTGWMPPTINYENADPECDLDVVPNIGRQTAVTHIMSNTFGFGGHNATLIFSKYQ